MNKYTKSGMTELQFLATVRNICGWLKLPVEHVENSLAGRVWLPGMPDLTIIGTRILYRELKSHYDSLSPAQRKVGSALKKAGGDFAMWKPADLFSGLVMSQLVAVSCWPGMDFDPKNVVPFIP